MQNPPKAKTRWRELIQRYLETRELPEELFYAVTRLVRYRNRCRPPHLYSPIGYWDTDNDAYKTIACNVLGKFIKKGRLEELYHTNRTDTAICSYVIKAIDWQGSEIARSRGAESNLLFRRLNAVLKASLFLEFPQFGWGLADWAGTEWVPLTQYTIYDRVREIEIRCPRRAQGSIWLHSVQCPKDLARFCELLLEKVRYPVSFELLQDAAEVHFNISEADEPENESRADDDHKKALRKCADPNGNFLSELETRDAVEKFVGKLTPADLLYLKELFICGKTQKELVAKRASKSTVSTRKRKLESKLRQLGLDLETMKTAETYFLAAIALRAGNGRHHDEIHGNSSTPATDRARESGSSEETAFQESAGVHTSRSTLDD